MKNIAFLLLFITSLGYSQNNDKQQKDMEFAVFQGLMSIRCDGIGALHKYVNNLKHFSMIKDAEDYMTTYKYNSYNSNYSYYVTIYNHLDGGFRVNSPNSFLYDIIVDIGKFVEVHKEGSVTFLVYEVEGTRFLINHSKDSRNGARYIIDFWCV